MIGGICPRFIFYAFIIYSSGVGVGSFPFNVIASPLFIPLLISWNSPIDDLIGMTFIPVSNELKNKPIKIIHIDGDNRNNHISNLKWVEDIEEWKEVVYKDIALRRYYISSYGRLKNRLNELILGSPDKDGYMRTALSTLVSSRSVGFHQLVANAFVSGHSTERHIVNHIDGDTVNNYWKNLEWTTFRGNAKHAALTGLSLSGEAHRWSHFKEDDIILICESLVRNEGNVIKVYRELSNKIPRLNRWVISVIKCKKCWTNISDKFFKYDDLIHIKKTYINEEIAKLICVTLVSNNGDIDRTLNDLHLLGKSNITKNHVTKIKYKLCWTQISDIYFDYNKELNEFVVL